MNALAEHAQDYLRLRRALGAQLTDTGPLLADFTNYLAGHSESAVTVSSTVAWASGHPGTSRGAIARRLAAVRGFATYLRAFDPATQVPPHHLLPAGPNRVPPHIYSDQEVTDLLVAARTLRPELRGASVAMVIGLMAAAGLRTGEVLRLDRDDFDPAVGTLAICKSKWGKSRRIPLHSSTVTALVEYGVLRDRCCRQPNDPALLLSRAGRRVSPTGFHHNFALARAQAQIPDRAPGCPARPYDLRHTFAVHTLRDWHAAGLDVRQHLPLLSTYLGHVNPDNTYWYLQAVPELMSVLVERLERFLDEAGGAG